MPWLAELVLSLRNLVKEVQLLYRVPVIFVVQSDIRLVVSRLVRGQDIVGSIPTYPTGENVGSSPTGCFGGCRLAD